MIYFDTPTKHELVNRMYDFTVDGGYLLIGHAETLDRNQTKWQFVRPGVYRKAGEGILVEENRAISPKQHRKTASKTA
jgi:chemotaxis methyl-accepting protein methylase